MQRERERERRERENYIYSTHVSPPNKTKVEEEKIFYNKFLRTKGESLHCECDYDDMDYRLY